MAVTRIIRSSNLALLALVVGLLWLIEIIDSALLDSQLQTGGIHPRQIAGLDGILWAPLLHSGFGHLASNTMPFVALGWLVALRGQRHVAIVTLATALGGGFLTWLLAGGQNHIGASGIVFGYFGALMTAAWLERRPSVLAPALVAIFLYGTMLVGLVPQDEISWEGHLFGMLAGVWTTRLVVGRRSTSQDLDDADRKRDKPIYPWEIDEPWLETDPDE